MQSFLERDVYGRIMNFFSERFGVKRTRSDGKTFLTKPSLFFFLFKTFSQLPCNSCSSASPWTKPGHRPQRAPGFATFWVEMHLPGKAADVAPAIHGAPTSRNPTVPFVGFSRRFLGCFLLWFDPCHGSNKYNESYQGGCLRCRVRVVLPLETTVNLFMFPLNKHSGHMWLTTSAADVGQRTFWYFLIYQ